MGQSAVFQASRAEGLHRLAEFAPRAAAIYESQRNFDRGQGNRDAVSTLSPYIRRRLVTEPEVLASVIEQHGAAACEKFIQEVFWRAYWKGYLELRPSIHQRYIARLRQQSDGLMRGGLAAAYFSAIEGKTGIDAFDHWAKELVETGYLHNHARMWFASIWMFTLRLPWELGADFFMQHLLDGDPASNTLSWRWVAGLHTRGKNYLAQRENIGRFSEGRYFPLGLIKAAPPLEESATDPIRPISSNTMPPDGPFVLLLTDEDLGVESLPFVDYAVAQIFIMTTAAEQSPNGVSEKVIDFARAAALDAVERVRLRFPKAAVSADLLDSARIDDVVSALAATGVGRVLIPHLAVGEARSAVDRLADRLIAEGIAVHCWFRAYDALTWPLATRGYFQFKDNIPAFLAQLGLVGRAEDAVAAKSREKIVIHQR